MTRTNRESIALQDNFVPDIMSCAKGLAAGYVPLAAAVSVELDGPHGHTVMRTEI